MLAMWMLKILWARLQQNINWEHPEVQAGLRKGRGTRAQIASLHWIERKQKNSRKYHLLLLQRLDLQALSVWITTNCGKFLKEIGTPDHLTCFLRNLYTGQEATVTTGYGTMGWFKIGRRVHQGWIVSSYFLNFYEENIKWNARLEETSWNQDCWKK